MAFPRRLLSPGEELVLDLRPHWISLVWPLAQTAVILAAVVAALLFVPASWPAWTRWGIGLAGALVFVAGPARRIVAWATSHFAVTSQRVIHREGWFAKRSKEIPLRNISDVAFHQGVFERLIGAGDLTLESPGEFGQETFDYIRHPESVQKTIYELTEENRLQTTSTGPVPVIGRSVAQELATLERLRRDGAISEQEFEAAKARVLRS